MFDTLSEHSHPLRLFLQHICQRRIFCPHVYQPTYSLQQLWSLLPLSLLPTPPLVSSFISPQLRILPNARYKHGKPSCAVQQLSQLPYASKNYHTSALRVWKAQGMYSATKLLVTSQYSFRHREGHAAVPGQALERPKQYEAASPSAWPWHGSHPLHHEFCLQHRSGDI
jgi:hypothetical protein